MTKSQLSNALYSAYINATTDNGIPYIKRNEDTENASQELRDAIRGVQYEIVDGMAFELSYEIMQHATRILSDMLIDETIDFSSDDITDTLQERTNGTANVYTAVRLSWLTPTNEDDIFEILKEYSTIDISTACAIWYDQQVYNACDNLVPVIINALSND